MHTTITRPDLFRPAYLTASNSRLLLSDFDVQASRWAAPPRKKYPSPYVLDGGIDLADAARSSPPPRLCCLRRFPSTELASIGDEIADGHWTAASSRLSGR